ncbi:MAG: hypothetical protein AB1468_02140 [Candidatus Micrarchaeota archaeon]
MDSYGQLVMTKKQKTPADFLVLQNRARAQVKRSIFGQAKLMHEDDGPGSPMSEQNQRALEALEDYQYKQSKAKKKA